MSPYPGISWHVRTVCASANLISRSFPPEDMLDHWLLIDHPEDSDQNVWMRRLKCVFDCRTCQLVPFAGRRLKSICFLFPDVRLQFGIVRPANRDWACQTERCHTLSNKTSLQ